MLHCGTHFSSVGTKKKVFKLWFVRSDVPDQFYLNSFPNKQKCFHVHVKQRFKSYFLRIGFVKTTVKTSCNCLWWQEISHAFFSLGNYFFHLRLKPSKIDRQSYRFLNLKKYCRILTYFKHIRTRLSSCAFINFVLRTGVLNLLSHSRLIKYVRIRSAYLHKNRSKQRFNKEEILRITRKKLKLSDSLRTDALQFAKREHKWPLHTFPSNSTIQELA